MLCGEEYCFLLVQTKDRLSPISNSIYFLCDLGKPLWILNTKQNLNGLVVDSTVFDFLASVCQGNLEPFIKTLHFQDITILQSGETKQTKPKTNHVRDDEVSPAVQGGIFLLEIQMFWQQNISCFQTEVLYKSSSIKVFRILGFSS